MPTNRTVQVNASLDAEIRPPRNKRRSYLFVQNNSVADVYYDEGTMATQENGIHLAAGQFLEFSENLGAAVPQGNIWLRGSSASPTIQKVLVKDA